MMVAKLALNDIIKLKKPHPCGTNEWRVVKLGMDIGLICTGCGHPVKIIRSKLEKTCAASSKTRRIKTIFNGLIS